MSQKLSKTEVLRGRNVFKELYAVGHRVEGQTLHSIVKPDQHPAKERIVFGVAMSRAVGRASVRNRVKRLVRESFRKNREHYLAQLQEASLSVRVVFMLNPKSAGTAGTLSFLDIQNDMNTVFSQLQQGRFR